MREPNCVHASIKASLRLPMVTNTGVHRVLTTALETAGGRGKDANESLAAT